jgi:hypothetical protein
VIRAALLALLVMAGAPCTPACAAAAGATLVLERNIPLPGVTGRVDHLTIDLKRRRLFVAKVGAGRWTRSASIPTGG